MEIVLMCAHESGSVAFNAEFIEGLPAPQRRYDIRNYVVTLDGGFADAILHHDADELLKNPLYRMPTPGEQEQMAAAQVQSGQIQESTEQSEDETPDVPPAMDDVPTQSKKKASGG